MLIDHHVLLRQVKSEVKPSQDRHSVSDRVKPSIFQYDYLVLKHLYQDMERLLSLIPHNSNKPSLAVDIGSDKSPYLELISRFGYQLKTHDLTADFGADFVGTAEETNLEDNSVDLIICTQVLEHTRSPSNALGEFRRILKPGGYVIFSVPHVWFYHPHPSDYWRMTQEGVVALCEDANFEVVEMRAQGGSIVGLCQVVNFVLYGAINKFGAIAFASLNTIAILLDKSIPNSLFSLNFACLAKK